ncbi:MAG: acetyl-CoA carboxylase carboxyltransferase subunit alpha [Gammaproteobacteria bacterium]
MYLNFLDFEHPIAEIEAQLAELRRLKESGEPVDLEIERLARLSQETTQEIFANLDAWKITQLSRHPQRPYTLDYIARLFTDVEFLAGDRSTADDPALVGGVARFEGRAIVFLGHQKGRDTKEKVFRNFGMPRPEGYRKALRLMRFAERFHLPLITFIDTPGAYPGIDAEKHNQSEAIARNLEAMAELRVPILSCVIGEGGSGGALAIGVGDRLLMLQYSIYSVISPEGCASILWKSASKAPEAASTLGLTADKIYALGMADEVIVEPLGGGHRDVPALMSSVREALHRHLSELVGKTEEDLLAERMARIMHYGTYEQ